jgi:hypothetical protein
MADKTNLERASMKGDFHDMLDARKHHESPETKD